MTNIWHELSFCDRELTEVNLWDACNVASIGNIMSYDENQMRVSKKNSLDNEIFNNSTILLIEDIVDLTTQRKLESSSETVKTV